MFITFIVLTILFLILTTTFKIDLKIKYNILKNIGQINVCVFKFLKIATINFTLIDDHFNFSKKNKKVLEVKIDLNDKNLQFFNDISKNLKNKIVVLNCNINCLLGLENPFNSCLFVSVINVALTAFYAQILAKNGDISLNKNVNIVFRHNVFLLSTKVSFLISLYDYFWAYFKAIKQKFRRESGKEKRS